LLEAYTRAEETGQQFMVQDIVPGESTSIFAYHGFWDHSGREVAWWTKQHLRGTELADGCYHVTVDAPEVAALSRRLLSAFNYIGCSHVELKLDPRDQVFRLMEINARTGLSTQQGVAAGVDLPWITYRYLTGRDPAEPGTITFRRGITYVNETTDVRAFLQYRKRGKLRFLPWLRSFLGATTKAHWAWNDPRPFVSLVGKLGISFLLSKLRGFKSNAVLARKRPKRAAA
jgi:predicted ATP-grasp superfamily ATP-dependent carboligase